MAILQFILVPAVVALLFVGEAGAACSATTIECRTGGQCVSLVSVCNSALECPDGSDEDYQICEIWKSNRNNCQAGNFKCQGSCHSVQNICSGTSSSSTLCTGELDPRACQMVKSRKLFIEPESMNLTADTIAMLSMAVNKTLSKQQPECPMLYTRVGDLCLAFFSPAKLSWAEARQFCHSIYGELLYFNDFSTFGAALAYMRQSLLTSDYWIGGRYDLDTNAWSWVVDDSPMPLGSPYWAERYNSSCVPRSPVPTDPFRGGLEILLGARCYHYLQAPRQRTPGWCAALTTEHFYYVSDEICEDTRSPLCIFNFHERNEI